MSRVESEADRMSTLVEDLLLLARLDAGPELDIRPTDLTEVVLNAVSDARAAGPDHTWRSSLPDEPVLGARRRATGCTRWWRTCWPTRVRTPPPGTGCETALAGTTGRPR